MQTLPTENRFQTYHQFKLTQREKYSKLRRKTYGQDQVKRER